MQLLFMSVIMEALDVASKRDARDADGSMTFFDSFIV
jgi:hypothetical protein